MTEKLNGGLPDKKGWCKMSVRIGITVNGNEVFHLSVEEGKSVAPVPAPVPATKRRASSRRKATQTQPNHKDTRTWAQVAYDAYYAEKRLAARGLTGMDKYNAHQRVRKAWGLHKGERFSEFVARVGIA